MQEEPNYDKSSPRSIYEFSLQLTGKCLSEVVDIPADVENGRNRGDLGSLIEKYFFRHVPASNKGPDFPEAELELKTTGVVKNSKGEFRAKERLVLGMINFDKIVIENWKDSSLISKCKRMLILFYLYDKTLPVTKRRFVIPPLLYELPESDLPVIQKDWEFIKNKILEGKAHELSEGDTFYLGACRKGAGGDGEPLRSQPNSNILAKSRAFSFKQNYLNQLILGHESEMSSLNIGKDGSFEKATRDRFLDYLGMSVEDISSALRFFKRNKNHKGFHRELAVRILAKGGSSIREFEKAGIEMKTVRLQANGRPKESMSFPAFDYMKIIETQWEDSTFFERIERKFLFVVFKTDLEGIERLEKVGYWNMPYLDRLEAERVWRETKSRVAINANDLPGLSESPIAHVRPKARDGNDKALTPQGTMRVKQCFWLNASYIARVVSEI